MRQPAAKQGDQIVASDTHIAMFPAGTAEVPTPVPHPFNGVIRGDVSSNVNIMGQPAATVGSLASDDAHPLIPPGATRFQKASGQQGKLTKGAGSSSGAHQRRSGGAPR